MHKWSCIFRVTLIIEKKYIMKIKMIEVFPLIVLIFLIFFCTKDVSAEPWRLPQHYCAVTAEKPGVDLLVQCAIEGPVEEDILTAMSGEVYREVDGQRYQIMIIDWDYEVEHVDNAPWGVTMFRGRMLDHIKIRQNRNRHAVGYRLYPKNIGM